MFNEDGSSWVVTSNCKNQELAKDFFKSTFAGSTELYDDLISKGALSTWSPASESNIGPFYYDARDAIGVALSNITQQNADMDSEIENAQATVQFNMGS